MKGAILSVEATYLVHATEDPARVGDAVRELLSTSTDPQEEQLEGHFGNAILKERIHLTGEEAASSLASLFTKFPAALKSRIRADLPLMIDEHSALFLRLDKQSLFSGSLKLGESDTVRVKVKPRLFQLKVPAAQIYAELLGAK